MNGHESPLPDETVVLTVTLGRFKQLRSELGVDVSTFREEDVHALQQLAVEDPRVDWNLYRAAHCVAESFAELRRPTVDEEDLVRMFRDTFDPPEASG